MPLPDAPSSPLTAPERARPRGAKVLLILGAVLLVAGVGAGRSGTTRVQGAVEDIQADGDEIRNSLLLEVPVPGEGDVELPPGRYDVFALAPDGTFNRRSTSTTSGPIQTDDTAARDPEDDRLPVVEITGPDGTRVRTSDPGLEAMFTAASGQLFAIESFTVRQRGDYHLQVTGTRVTKVGIGPSVDTGNFGRLVGGGLFALLGFVIGGLGFIFAVAGLIWFLVGGSAPPPPHPAGPWGPSVPAWGRPVAGPGPRPPWGGPPPGPPSGARLPPPPASAAAHRPPPTGPTGPDPSPPPAAAPPPWGAAPPTRPTSWPDDPTRPGA